MYLAAFLFFLAPNLHLKDLGAMWDSGHCNEGLDQVSLKKNSLLSFVIIPDSRPSNSLLSTINFCVYIRVYMYVCVALIRRRAACVTVDLSSILPKHALRK